MKLFKIVQDVADDVPVSCLKWCSGAAGRVSSA